MKNALSRLNRPIPDEWYDDARLLQGHAGHGDRARGRDPVAGLDRQARPRARARGGDRPPRARRRHGRLHLRLHDLERRLGARRAVARAAGRHGPGQGQGLGRLERARPVHRHRRRARRLRPRHARARQRRAVGRVQLGRDAPHVRRHDRLRVALADALPGRALRLGDGARRLGAGARPLAGSPATSSSSRSRGSACCATASEEREAPEWPTSSAPSGPPRRGRRTGWPRSARR